MNCDKLIFGLVVISSITKGTPNIPSIRANIAFCVLFAEKHNPFFLPISGFINGLHMSISAVDLPVLEVPHRFTTTVP